MSAGSLRLRLSVAAAGLIALALVAGGAGVFLIFDTALDRRTADELNHTARLLAGGVGFGSDGAIVVDRPPADPRYAVPYGGLYWQIESAGREPLRSRSLWDQRLALPAPNGDMAHHAVIDLAGPDGAKLIAVYRTVRLKSAPDEPLLVITAAMDRAQLAPSRDLVLRLLPPSVLALGLLLALAMAAFVRRALSPFRTLRADLKAAHEGGRQRLGGGYPSEVQPLVDDLNRLVGQQEAALERAQAQAADMAHGLKTPLAVLDALARRIDAAEPALAAEIDEHSRAMQEQVTRTLARARAAASAGLQQRRTEIAPVVAQIVSAMKRLPGSERIDWRVEVPAGSLYPASEGDLFELLGALVDNARKWARGEVRLSIVPGGAIVVEDDGPGMEPAEIAAIGRGRRWDEATPGTGFGLAIAQDLAAATGGRLVLSRSALGGLRAAIEWGRPQT